jgi:hypothetical protein
MTVGNELRIEKIKLRKALHTDTFLKEAFSMNFTYLEYVTLKKMYLSSNQNLILEITAWKTRPGAVKTASGGIPGNLSPNGAEIRIS